MSEKTKHTIIIGDARGMSEIADKSVHLIITSPPYWQLKDYGAAEQIGYNDSYQDYIDNLNQVWNECYRILYPGCRLCVNIGDQFARSVFYGRYKVIPIRTEIIKHCESIGFDYMGAIIWQKVTTCKTTGGATVMGSFPYPRNGIIKIDYEFILIFKKLGKEPRVSKEVKEQSKLTQGEWNEYFNGHWYFPGEKQNGHIAMFPLELPKRLIKMFSFVGDTVLDPFLGSGTTSRAALELGRNSIGYEINAEFLDIINTKIGIAENGSLFPNDYTIEIIFQKQNNITENKNIITNKIDNNIERLTDPKQFNFGTVIDTSGKKPRDEEFRIKSIVQSNEIILESGLKVKLLGIIPIEDDYYKQKAINYMKKLINGRKVVLKYDSIKYDSSNQLLTYVYLTNKTFINAKLIMNGFAFCNRDIDFYYKNKFLQYEEKAKTNKRGFWEKQE
jgi:site-specific DNA-methyltransferase (adenine-specific)